MNTLPMQTFGFDHPDLERCEVPADGLCMRCGEPIKGDDTGFMIANAENNALVYRPWHRQCLLKSVRPGRP